MPSQSIEYPYLPEGREYLYVPESNEFMQAAKEAAQSHGCRKHATGAVAVKDGEIIATGNNAGTFVKICPRVYKNFDTGEGYRFCKEYCQQEGHAEVVLCNYAKKNKINLKGADLYLYGHWWMCQNCWDFIIKAGINKTYLMEGSEILFNYEHQKDDLFDSQQKLSVYVSGSLTHLKNLAIKQLYEDIGKLAASLNMTSYVPHLHTDPVKFPDATPEEIYNINKNQVASSDLMICYTGEPSLGAGQEIEIANNSKTLVILLSEEGQTVARMAKGSPNIIDHILFKDHQDALNQLKTRLLKLIDASKKQNVSVKL